MNALDDSTTSDESNTAMPHGVTNEIVRQHTPISRKQERLIRQIQRAGVKASIKEHHLVSKEELLSLKIQVLPIALRVAIGCFGLASLAMSIYCFQSEQDNFGFLYGLGAIFLVLFAFFGVKKTVSATLEAWDSISTNFLVEQIIHQIGKAVGSILNS